MLHLQIDGENLQKALERLSDNFKPAVQRGLTTAVKEVFREAHEKLSGPGRKDVRTRNYGRYIDDEGKRKYKFRKTRSRGQSDMLGGRPGSYPVPVLTGNLRSHLYAILPGRSKSSENDTVTAGELEAVLWNSAQYALTVHEGWGSSQNYGPRPFATDALEKFDRSVGIARTIEKELSVEIKKQGLD